MSTVTRGSLTTSRTWQVVHSMFSWHYHDYIPSSGVRPGPYWQIMWRFISPALMSAVIASSIYFMLTNNPKYSAWNKEQVNCGWHWLFIDHKNHRKTQIIFCKTRPNLKIGSTVTLAWCLQQSLPSPALFPLLEEQFFMLLEGRSLIVILWIFHICVSWKLFIQAAERELLPVFSDPPRWHKRLHSSNDVQLWGKNSPQNYPCFKFSTFLASQTSIICLTTKKPSNFFQFPAVPGEGRISISSSQSVSVP